MRSARVWASVRPLVTVLPGDAVLCCTGAHGCEGRFQCENLALGRSCYNDPLLCAFVQAAVSCKALSLNVNLLQRAHVWAFDNIPCKNCRNGSKTSVTVSLPVPSSVSASFIHSPAFCIVGAQYFVIVLIFCELSCRGCLARLAGCANVEDEDDTEPRQLLFNPKQHVETYI